MIKFKKLNHPLLNSFSFLIMTLSFFIGVTSIPLQASAEENKYFVEAINKEKTVYSKEIDRSTVDAVNYYKYLWYFEKNHKTNAEEKGLTSSILLLDPPVATVSIFSDADQDGSSGGSSSYYGHAFITIKNNSGSTISVGNLSGIQSNKTVSVGTWGNKAEHTGLWYDLESYFVSQGSYSGRISVSYIMNSSELATLNSMIINGDSWSYLSNCSTFAKNAWNAVAPDPYDLSAGWPINTPSGLASSIQSVFSGSYSTNAAVPYDYVVYYANGTGAPIRSSVY